MVSTKKKKTNCPYLDEINGSSCQLSASGLIIPTREHILNYCKNERYSKCHHYIQNRISIEQRADYIVDDNPVSNRRRFMRIPTSQQVKVSHYYSEGNREEILDDDATSVDLSLGGIRIITKASLDIDETVAIFFGEEIEPQGFKGKGDVKWIQSAGHGDTIKAGLSFTDQATCNAARNYIIGLGL
jgi:hypothetical protein